MPFLFLVLYVFSWGPRQLCTFVRVEFSFVTCSHLRNFSKYMVPLVTYIRQGRILLLNHFLFSDLHPFEEFCQVYGFTSNVHPSRQNFVTQPFFFVFLTYTHLRDFAKCMASSVTYIHQGGILLLSHFFVFLTYTHLRDFAKCMALSVTYNHQGRILLLSLFFFFFCSKAGQICLHEDIG